jgi:hypothetical protein
MRQEEGEGREWWSGGVVVRRDGLESQPASSVFPTPIFAEGTRRKNQGWGEQPFGEHREVFSYSGSWLLTAGRVECWFEETAWKVNRPLRYFLRQISCRGEAEEESGLGVNSLLVNTERVFSYSGS